MANNLSLDGTDFIKELIKNADQCQYSQAKTPKIEFDVYPDRLVVEHNEDGFTPDDVVALCSMPRRDELEESVGRYTRGHANGFKSVFAATSIVHVRSGPFSFHLHYDRLTDANGLGMLVPIWDDVNEHSLKHPQPSTQLTLMLSSPAERLAMGPEFLILPAETLLFLRNLKCLTVNDLCGSNSLQSVQYMFQTSGLTNRAALEVVTLHEGGLSRRSKKHYHVFRKFLTAAPHDALQDSPRVHDLAEVVLAFPISQDGSPTIQKQSIYNYLPIRSYGFNVSAHNFPQGCTDSGQVLNPFESHDAMEP